MCSNTPCPFEREGKDGEHQRDRACKVSIRTRFFFVSRVTRDASACEKHFAPRGRTSPYSPEMTGGTYISHYFVLREKKETFSVASLQLTVQLPCRNVFSSFILPLRACQKRSFHDVSTVGPGAERGVNNRQTNQSPQSLRSTKIRA